MAELVGLQAPCIRSPGPEVWPTLHWDRTSRRRHKTAIVSCSGKTLGVQRPQQGKQVRDNPSLYDSVNSVAGRREIPYLPKVFLGDSMEMTARVWSACRATHTLMGPSRISRQVCNWWQQGLSLGCLCWCDGHNDNFFLCMTLMQE